MDPSNLDKAKAFCQQLDEAEHATTPEEAEDFKKRLAAMYDFARLHPDATADELKVYLNRIKPLDLAAKEKFSKWAAAQTIREAFSLDPP